MFKSLFVKISRAFFILFFQLKRNFQTNSLKLILLLFFSRSPHRTIMLSIGINRFAISSAYTNHLKKQKWSKKMRTTRKRQRGFIGKKIYRIKIYFYDLAIKHTHTHINFGNMSMGKINGT